jgi:hypothetical protein
MLEGVDLVLLDAPRMAFCARGGTTIEVPERGVELLWVIGYMLWREYCDYLDGAKGAGVGIWRPLITWAVGNQFVATREDWPHATPCPTGFDNSQSEPSFERVADEIALCATGWLLHHELAHIRRGHVGAVAPDVSRQQEREADEAATGWLLEMAPKGIATTKRACGIAAAIIALAALELHQPPPPSTDPDHPPTSDRIFHCLSQSGINEKSVELMIAALGVRAILLHYGHEVPVSAYETPQECLDDFCRVLDLHVR